MFCLVCFVTIQFMLANGFHSSKVITYNVSFGRFVSIQFMC